MTYAALEETQKRQQLNLDCDNFERSIAHLQFWRYPPCWQTRQWLMYFEQFPNLQDWHKSLDAETVRYINIALFQGFITENTLPEILIIADTIRKIDDKMNTSGGHIAEAIQYGSFKGLQAVMADELERIRDDGDFSRSAKAVFDRAEEVYSALSNPFSSTPTTT